VQGDAGDVEDLGDALLIPRCLVSVSRRVRVRIHVKAR
jgi:hypothetical protein